MDGYCLLRVLAPGSSDIMVHDADRNDLRVYHFLPDEPLAIADRLEGENGVAPTETLRTPQGYF